MNENTKLAASVPSVGHFKGHLTKASKLWNNLDNVVPQDQMTPALCKKMQNPSPMTETEQSAAINAGLPVKNGFVMSRWSR